MGKDEVKKAINQQIQGVALGMGFMPADIADLIEQLIDMKLDKPTQSNQKEA